MSDASGRARAARDRLAASLPAELSIHDGDWDDEDLDLPESRPCTRCGKDPAEGFASIWTLAEGERWYCHGDDDEIFTCYEGASR